jgi:hypothetical protein
MESAESNGIWPMHSRLSGAKIEGETMINVKGYLVERDNRSLFIRDINEASWALEDSEYTVTPLVAMKSADVYEQFIVADPKEESPSLPSTDDTAERIELMNELFDLQQAEIDFLKNRLEEFVEVVEGIVELTEVISQSSIENRSKLIVIGDSCKAVLNPSE